MEEEFEYKEITNLNEVKNKILEPRRELLIEFLVNFIENLSKSLIQESVQDLYNLKVVNFEFDQPFTFSYVASSGCSHIPFESTNRIVDNLEIEDAEYGELEEIFEELGFETEDGGEWFNEETSECFNEHELCRKMECFWFYECWQDAKKKAITSVNYRCFLIEHDDFGGIDADTGIFMTDKEIRKSLIADGSFIAPIYESKYIIHKKDTKEIGGTEIKAFSDFDEAYQFLKSFVNNSNEENADENYLIRKWKKLPIEGEGQYLWVIDTDFGKKFID